jgi:hypothetical protein
LNSFSKTSTVLLSKLVNRTSFTLHHSHSHRHSFSHPVLSQNVNNQVEHKQKAYEDLGLDLKKSSVV